MWSAVAIRRGERVVLGHVKADDYPRALQAAWDRWPQFKDSEQVQLGFSIRRLA